MTFSASSVNLCVFSLLIFRGYCELSEKETNFREVTIMRDRYKTSNLIFTQITRSKIQCGSWCVLCQSFSYNTGTSTCNGYDVIITDTSSSVSSSGWRSYNKVNTAPSVTTTPSTTTTAPSTTTTAPPTTSTTAPPTTTSTTALSTTTTLAPTTTPAPTTVAPCTVCPPDYICRQSIYFCYKYYGTRKSRLTAESSCASEGAELAIIDNADKDNEIQSYISTNSITELFYWVQGAYVNDQWRYDDGTPVSYFRWAPNHPYRYEILAFNRDNGFHGATDAYDDVYFCQVKL